MIQLCMLMVVAGLIWRGDQVLIAQRSAGRAHALEWEFPGGKVEPGESAEEALVRELVEELGINAELGPEFARYENVFSGTNPFLLIFFRINSYRGTITNRGMFEKLVWESPANLSHYQFLEGDLPLIQLLREVEIDQVD